MGEILTFDYKMAFKSYVSAVQTAYSEYKTALIKRIETTWIGDDGCFIYTNPELGRIAKEKEEAYRNALKTMMDFREMYADHLK